jgi:hypothetical protein
MAIALKPPRWPDKVVLAVFGGAPMFTQDAAKVLVGAVAPGKGSIPWNLDVVSILKLGGIGLCFLLVFLCYLLLKKQQTQPPEGRPSPSTIYAFMTFAGILFVISLVSQFFDQGKIPLVEHEKQIKDLKDHYEEIIAISQNMNIISGKIARPKDGLTLEKKKIDCAGRVVRFHKESGLHLWLAVEVNGYIWPKEPELDVGPDGEWAAFVFQDGPEMPFSLDLLVVDENTHLKFMTWIHNRKFDKMDWPAGALRLDRIDGLRLKAKP